MKCITLAKTLKTYRKAANRCIYCISFIGQLLFAFKRGAFRSAMADIEHSNISLNYDAAEAVRNSQHDQVLHPYLLRVYELRTELQSRCGQKVSDALLSQLCLADSYVKFVLVARRLGCFSPNCYRWVLELGSRNSAGFFLPCCSHQKTLNASKYSLVHNSATPHQPGTQPFAAPSPHLWLFAV